MKGETMDIKQYLIETTDRTTGCWLWQSSNKANVITTKKCGKYYHSKTPKSVAWELKYGQRPCGYLKPHCGNELCINPDHQIETTKLMKNKTNPATIMPIIKIESAVFWKMDELDMIDWSHYGIPVYEGQKIIVVKSVQKMNARV